MLDLGRGRKEERLHGEQGGGASGYGGARRLGFLVEDRRREEASELREARAVLMAGSAQAE